MQRRRMFEPKGWFDRLFYALLALTGPYTAIVSFSVPDLQFAAAIMAVWSLIAAFYTIEWALFAYRASRRDGPSPRES